MILALDGLQPDAGHEVWWVLHDCCWGEVGVARSLLGATEHDLVPLLAEAATVCQQRHIPMAGVLNGGHRSIRNAVANALPGIPPHFCQVHDLCEATPPMAVADLHARKERNKQGRGVRPLERA